MPPKSSKFIASDDDLDDYDNDGRYKPSKGNAKKSSKPSKKQKRIAEEDETDEELEDDEEDDEGEAKSTDDDGDDDGDDHDDDKPAAKRPKAKKPKVAPSSSASSSSKLLKNSDGDQYVVLGQNKRVTVRKFKGNVLVDIRETYDKDGKEGLPGKKGISLNPELWAKLKASVADIDSAIASL